MLSHVKVIHTNSSGDEFPQEDGGGVAVATASF